MADSAERGFLRYPETPLLARAWTRSVLDRWPGCRGVENLILVVNELVCNALAGRGPISVALRREGARVGVAVSGLGGGTGRPAPGPAGWAGRGLIVVRDLAESWGVDQHADPDGTTVWALLAG